MDYFYKYLKNYKDVKDDFLDSIAAASSYLLRLLLVGSKEDYNKATIGLSAQPESMIHSFSTVLEREAPVNESHLPSDILKILNFIQI